MRATDPMMSCAKRCGGDPKMCEKNEICFNNIACLRVPPGRSPSPAAPVPPGPGPPGPPAKPFPIWVFIAGGAGVALLIILVLFLV